MSAKSYKRRVKARESAQGAQQSAEWIMLEFLGIAALFGGFVESWWGFWGALVGLLLIYASPLAPILFIVISSFWAYVVYMLLDKKDIGLQIPMTIIGFIVSMGVHYAAQWWHHDE